MTPITVFESRRSDAEAVSLKAAVAARVPFRHPFAPFPNCVLGPCMILVERRQPNHNIGAFGRAFAGPLASPRDRASDAALGTRIFLYAAARSRCQRRSRIQHISASFLATATRAMCRLDRFRTRS